MRIFLLFLHCLLVFIFSNRAVPGVADLHSAGKINGNPLVVCKFGFIASLW
jgi:hypothetical protein